MTKVLIATDLHPYFMDELEKMGIICTYRPQISKEETKNILADYQGLVVRTQFPIDQDLLSAGIHLEFIGRAGAGLDNIDLVYAESRKIICLNAPEGNRGAVSEHTLGLLLALANHLVKGNQEIRQGIWNREGNRGFEIEGKTVGIMGMGNTGMTTSRKLVGLGCQVIGYDPYKSGYAETGIQEGSLIDIWEQSDIISIHVPLTGETRGMVNDDFLSRFRKPFILLNTSRGEVIKTGDLIGFIRSGKVIGAGLDVLESEKFPISMDLPWFKELITLDQVILSPHVAGWTTESYLKISKVLASKIKDLYSLKKINH